MRFPLVTVLLATLVSSQSQADDPHKSFTLDISNAYLAPDGFYRSTAVANGVFPGPTITANRGDLLSVTVNNHLSDSRMRRSTSIHWHGIFQTYNSYNDGPAFVTQCPVAPDHSYTYKVNVAEQAGTYWYHSHLSSQYVDGIRGPLIIYDPNDPHAGLYDVDNEDTVIVLSDWYHSFASDVQTQYLSPNNTYSTDPMPDSGLINGKGRYKNGPSTDRAVFNVDSNTRYRFRIINASAMGMFRFSIEGHSFTVIEADGVNCVPMIVDYLEISAGQRYSIVLTASQAVKNYWIRAPMINVNAAYNPNLDPQNVFGVLRYTGAPAAEPTTVTGYASGVKLQEPLLAPLENPGAPGLPEIGGADKVFNLAFSVEGGNVATSKNVVWKINGVSYKPPTVPTLLKVLSGANNDGDFDTSENSFVIRSGDVVEINLSGVNHPHPFHLHGHTFDVVRINGVQNYVNPPRRDVVTTGPGTTAIRFKADNPGPWVLHCHMEWHLEGGLAVVFVEDPEGQRSAQQPSLEWEQLCPIYNALAPDLQ